MKTLAAFFHCSMTMFAWTAAMLTTSLPAQDGRAVPIAPAAGTSAQVAAKSAEKKPFVHPGILHNRAELAFVKARIDSGAEPWKSAWDQLRTHTFAQLDWKTKARADVVRGVMNNPNRGASDMERDAAAAYVHAVQWWLVGEKAHAEKAIEILNAYSATLKSVTGHDARLLVGMTGINFLNAAELVRHSDAGWKADDQRRFERLLREVLYPVIRDFYPDANGNWDAAMLQTMLAMGVFLDDRAMFDRAADYCLNGRGNGAIPNYLNEFGECQESGRDQAHTQMGLGYLGCACEIGWKQGVDLYGARQNRLALGYEYTAKYNLGNDVPYQPYRSFQGRYNYPAISVVSRGRFSAIYERVYHHYHDRLGLEMPFTKRVLDQTRPEKWNLQHASWGTLMFAEMPAGM
ncbi:MAG: alginate lyase family protein [Pirellulales bacterium]